MRGTVVLDDIGGGGLLLLVPIEEEFEPVEGTRAAGLTGRRLGEPFRVSGLASAVMADDGCAGTAGRVRKERERASEVDMAQDI